MRVCLQQIRHQQGSQARALPYVKIDDYCNNNKNEDVQCRDQSYEQCQQSTLSDDGKTWSSIRSPRVACVLNWFWRRCARCRVKNFYHLLCGNLPTRTRRCQLLKARPFLNRISSPSWPMRCCLEAASRFS